MIGYDYAFKRAICRRCKSDVSGILHARVALRWCRDYLSERADAEYTTDSAAPSGNEEMQLLGEVNAALSQLGEGGDCPLCRYLTPSPDRNPQGGDAQQGSVEDESGIKLQPLPGSTSNNGEDR